jgi:xylitol oxidase
MPTATMNWAGNLQFGAAQVHRPTSIDDLQYLVASSEHIRALGTGHSFSAVADSSGDLVTLADLPQVVQIDEANLTVTVNAAIRYGELAKALQARGYALHNLASLPHISVAGACATGTHGSGNGNGALPTAVRAMQLVGADGVLVQVSRATDRDRLDATVVGLGALGIVTLVTLEIEPTYDVRQLVYDDLPYRNVTGRTEEIFASGYSVSLFTDLRESRFTQVWFKQRLDASADPPVPRGFHGATLADGPRHPVPGMDPVHCTEQGGVPGPWHERLPHFRLDFVPSNGEELQSEYLIPRCLGSSAIEAIDGIREQIAPVLQICELRSIAADDIWLSPAYRRDSLGIHFTWVKDTAAVAPALLAIERQLEPYQARPHWGKLFAMGPDRLADVYQRVPDFTAMRARHDPSGRFGNGFVDHHLAGT